MESAAKATSCNHFILPDIILFFRQKKKKKTQEADVHYVIALALECENNLPACDYYEHSLQIIWQAYLPIPLDP